MSRSSRSSAKRAAAPAPIPGFTAVPHANPAGGNAAGLEERLARLEQRLTELTFMQGLSGGPALHIACAAQFITRTHGVIFPPLRGSLAGQRVAVLASGPTLRQAPSLEGCLTTACNHSYTFLGGAGPDFYAAADYVPWNREYIDAALRELPGECRIFLGYYVSPGTPPEMQIPWALREDPRVTTFCAAASPFPRMELELYPVYHNSSIAHDMLHLMLYMSPDIIYLLGCDCSPTGYFDDRSNPAQTTMDAGALIHGYNMLRALQQTHRPHTRIVSVNPVGLRGVFEDVYTPQFLALHPELRVSAAQVVERI